MEETIRSRTWGIRQDNWPLQKDNVILKKRRWGTIFDSEKLVRHNPMQVMNLDWIQKDVYIDILEVIRGIGLWNWY